MAHFSIDQSSRDRLAAMPGVTIIDHPSPHHPGDIALVMAGLRCCEVFADGAAFRAAYHLRYGEWLPLAEEVGEDAAFAAVFTFLTLVAAVPQHYAAAHDATERKAAAEVLVAFSGISVTFTSAAAA
ncbi:hypothetical protein [Paracraurococcus lichenis]|uniref:Uncharacterized protein n=1 Tax=Paracraurococcus lichenis TaxID=3064888 RepID=A0ABT9EC93_9PROT|nr:hypothetical protein [Paracraurococcus sp. LOR1-02]MDO9713696.1 hypothetical protein [Paracraurococcus sp. LOR1-02]